MKNLFFIPIFIFSYHISMFSQSEKVFYNSNWEVSNSNDYEYYIVVDKANKNDEYKSYFKSGEVKSIFYCSEFNFESITKSKFYSKYNEFAKNGTSLCEGNFEGGNKIGQWFYYYDEKKLKSEINYSNDVLNGKTINYFDNGNVKFEGDFLNGQKNGKWGYYFQNGEKKYEETYQNGVSNGSYISYFETKKIYEKGNLTNGFKDGNWLTNYSDGTIKTIEDYDNGSKKPKCYACNEYKKCKVVISNNFLKSEIQSDWIVSDSTYYQNTDDGILASFTKEKKKENFYINLNIPWKNYDDISLEVTFKNTENSNLQYGISWNENDIENTSNQFLISNQGTYKIDNLEDNVYLGSIFGKSTLIKSEIGAENVLKITKKEESIYYSINGSLVETQKLKVWEGSTFKIMLLNNDKSVASSLIIKDFIFKDTEMYESVENGLETGRFNWSGSGTGFYVNNDGFIATNYHVIQDASEIWVLCKQNGLKQKFKATVFQTDKINDLAIIKITDKGFVPLPKLPYQLASATIAVGNEVFSLGYPLADIMGETVKFTDGKISSLTGVGEDVTMYQVTAPIQNGNSGGPLFDKLGNIVGVIESRLNKEKYSSENVNYAVKSSLLKNIVDLVPLTPQKDTSKKTSSLSQVDKIKVFSDYVVMIQTN